MEGKKIIVVGCSISGGLFARRILQLHPKAKITLYEKMKADQISKHWTQPVNGAALNINPNGMSTIKKYDFELYNQLLAMANPRLHIKAVSMCSRITKPLFCVNMLEYANDPGIIIRWNDIIKLIRKPLENYIFYNCALIHYTRSNGKFVLILQHQDEFFTDYCDILIAADGRFSKIREMYQKPQVTPHNVVNFRLLVPNTTKYSFDDLTLYYNDQNHQLARMGVASIKPTDFLNEESIYIFGNFKVDSSFKKSQFKRDNFIRLYHNQQLTKVGQTIIEIVLSNFENIHWARFQSTNICLKSEKDDLYFLGDAAHAFPPSLGQGATLAIEDAYLIANYILQRNFDLETHYQRIQHIKDCSEYAALHLINNDLNMEIDFWNDKQMLKKMHQIWSK
jgi:2-polyprenyl-6-methoxyphenol hydroxylase-like FAD-dependent oxidoreductase